MEPAVIQNKALHPDACGPVGQVAQGVEVVVEGDGLPDVQDDRLFARMLGQGALPDVQAVHDRIHAMVGGRDHDPGRAVLLALVQNHLAGQQELASADTGRGGAVPVHPEHGVPAPGRLNTEHPAVMEVEAGGAHHDHGPLEAGTAPAELAHPGPVGQVVALGAALTLVPAGEVQNLGLLVVQGQADLQTLQQEGVGAQVAQGVANPQGTASHGLHPGLQAKLGILVAGLDSQRFGGLLGLALDQESRRPGTAGLDALEALGDPMTGQARMQVGVLRMLQQQGRMGRGPGGGLFQAIQVRTRIEPPDVRNIGTRRNGPQGHIGEWLIRMDRLWKEHEKSFSNYGTNVQKQRCLMNQ